MWQQPTPIKRWLLEVEGEFDGQTGLNPPITREHDAAQAIVHAALRLQGS
ncbi:MAG: hypothetical protein HQ582_24575, partial [Planctomycetes bacterium]|nr:hypothetical protein [Planctomycetota bacterium]